MIIIKVEEGDIKESMATDVEDLLSGAKLYGWECTREFHGVWLSHLKQGTKPHVTTRR